MNQETNNQNRVGRKITTINNTGVRQITLHIDPVYIEQFREIAVKTKRTQRAIIEKMIKQEYQETIKKGE